MAGSMLAIGVLAASSTLALGLVAVGGAAVAAQRAAGAADAAALAAADAASGAVAVTEAPCALAAKVALASGTELVDCVLDGLVATVAVRIPFAGLAADVRARAGPAAGE